MAIVGRASAGADLGKWQFSGFPAWLAWLIVHLIYLVEFENKILVFDSVGMVLLQSQSRGTLNCQQRLRQAKPLTINRHSTDGTRVVATIRSSNRSAHWFPGPLRFRQCFPSFEPWGSRSSSFFAGLLRPAPTSIEKSTILLGPRWILRYPPGSTALGKINWEKRDCQE
jgi:hypothetical protein